jgi:hypothetical protein
MGRRGRKPKKERKGYFYEEQEQAVADYIAAEGKEEKERIYNEHLHTAFTKMIESIIRRYNLFPPDEEFDETFNDTISFLMTKIDHFNPDSGYKAYSYCGTICKNYLIYKINQFTKRKTKNSSYDEMVEPLSKDNRYSYSETPSDGGFANEMISGAVETIERVLSEKDKYRINENDEKVGRALVSLMNNWDDIFAQMGSNKFNKSSIYLFLKETTLLTQKEIRDCMKKYKSLYYKTKKTMLENI